jgi:hypothetical protein
VLIGQKKAMGIAVHNDRPQRRYSGLLASLRGDEAKDPFSFKSHNAIIAGAKVERRSME